MLELGTSLREARERRRLGVEQVEAATLIPARYLRALEDEQFDRLPRGLYQRSSLRSYADFLGLDGAAYAEEYEQRLLSREPEPPRRRERLQGFDRLGERLTGSAIVGLAAAALALVAALVWLTGGSLSEPLTI